MAFIRDYILVAKMKFSFKSYVSAFKKDFVVKLLEYNVKPVCKWYMYYVYYNSNNVSKVLRGIVFVDFPKFVV